MDAEGNPTLARDNFGIEVRSEYNSRNRLSVRTWDGPTIDPARIEFDSLKTEDAYDSRKPIGTKSNRSKFKSDDGLFERKSADFTRT